MYFLKRKYIFHLHNLFITICEINHKRGSVLSNHLSRPAVANRFKRHTQKRDGQPLKCSSIRSCSKWGLHSREVAITLVSSYLAFPPLPEKQAV